MSTNPIKFSDRLVINHSKKSKTDRFYNGCEWYWSLGGRRVKTLSCDKSHHLKVKIKEKPLSGKTKFKAVLIRLTLGATGIVPLVTLLGKIAFRRTHTFTTVQRAIEETSSSVHTPRVDSLVTRAREAIQNKDPLFLKEIWRELLQKNPEELEEMWVNEDYSSLLKKPLEYLLLKDKTYHVKNDKLRDVLAQLDDSKVYINQEGHYGISNPQTLSEFIHFVPIYYCPANPSKVDHLLQDPRIQSLNMRQNTIQNIEDLINTLKNNNTLTSLNLSGIKLDKNQIDLLCDFLKKYQTLKTIDLTCTYLGSYGANAIADVLQCNTSLTAINLTNNQFGDEEIKVITQALERNNTLTSLDLSASKIGTDGALSIANLLRTNSTLTDFIFNNSQLDPQSSKIIFDAVKRSDSLKNLTFQSHPKSHETAPLLEALKENKSLTHLNIHGCEIGSSGAKTLLDVLKNNTHLKSLDLGNNAIDNEGAGFIFEGLRKNRSLKKLSLKGNEIDLEGIFILWDFLKENQTLTSLNLALSRNLKDSEIKELAEILKDNKILTHLNLSGNKIGEVGGKALLEMLKTNKTLSYLDLFLCDEIPPEIKRELEDYEEQLKIVFNN